MNRYFPRPSFLRGGFSSRLKQGGYSLYDLIITSTVASVLGVGAVSMASLLQETRMTTAVNLLIGDLNLARSEAIKRHAVVTQCKSSNGASCSQKSAWQDGWIIFTDDNKNYEVDAGEVIIRVQQSLGGNTRLRYGGEKASYTHVAYYPPGYARPNATFTFCDQRGSEKAKTVIINSVGRPYSYAKTWDEKSIDCPKDATP